MRWDGPGRRRSRPLAGGRKFKPAPASARRPPSLALEEVNAFNARWRYVRLSIADGQARLQMDVNLDAGVTADNFEDTLDIWRQLLEMFERDILQIP